MAANQASLLSRPQATAACRFGGVVKVRNWCALAITLVSAGAAQMKPTFQPVRANILPAEPIFTQRSRMPGKADQRMVARPSNTTCSQTSSQTAIDVVAHAELGQQRQVLLAATTVAGGIERVVQHHQPRALG